jgi:undecaprenyl-diphosphatase
VINWHLIWLAVVQGVTELFPVSSLGHSVLVPAVLQWPIDRDAPWFLPYLVVLHLGTALALLVYFYRDWLDILASLWRSRGRPVEPEARLFWLLVAGTIPAGILGLAFEHALRDLFASFVVVATVLMVNGIILIFGDKLKRRQVDEQLGTLRWLKAVGIGCAQALALIPGISRSGVTLVAGLGAKLDYEDSARFSFLLATPIIAAAGLLEVPKLVEHRAHMPDGLLWVIVGSGIVAGILAYLSTWFLMVYFKAHELTALRPFGIYCLLAGGGALAWYFL